MATTETLLGQCIARSMVADGATAETANAWSAFKATHRASRVAAFIVLWAIVLRATVERQLSHAAMQRELGMSSATFYRRLSDFRDLFGLEQFGPTYDDPTPIARAMVASLPAKPGRAVLAGEVPVALPVAA